MSGSGNASVLQANWSGYSNYSSGNYIDFYHSMVIYVLPVIIIVGTVGNVLSIVTVCSRHFRHAPCTVLLFILAIVDTLVLVFAGGYLWCVNTFLAAWALMIQHPRLDCFVTVIKTVLHAMSPWTVVLITFERFVSVMWPFRAGAICSRWKMVISWFAVLLIIIALVCSCFYLAAPDAAFSVFHWPWIRFAITGVVPLVLIVAGNAGIVYKTCVANRNRTRAMDSSSSAAASAASDARSITIMLVAVCAVFVVTVYPKYVAFLAMRYHKYTLQMDVMHSFSVTLYYVNSASNFILYFITGRLFRKAFLQVMCRGKRQASPRHNVQRGLQRRNNTGETEV